LGHHFWGVNARNEIVVDAPIDPTWAFPEGTPPMARVCANPHRYSQGELETLLTQKPYSQSSTEISSCFEQRPLKYRWTDREAAFHGETVGA
jgi:hypothetical protein